MVSIIVPAYNCESYITECISSLQNQNIQAVEILVIDDGSKDRTPEILDQLAKQDNRISVYHVNNGGPSKARNIGLDNAKGEWILFVDADDWVDKDILSNLDLNIATAPDIIFFGFKRCYDNGILEKCCPVEEKASIDCYTTFEQLTTLFNSKDEFFGYSVNKIYKRQIIEEHKIRFKEGLHVREDEVFALDYCIYIHSVQTLSCAPYNYRIISTSLSHNVRSYYRNYKLLIDTELKLLDNFEDCCFVKSFRNKIFKYYLASIDECIYERRDETKSVISEAVGFYKQNCDLIEISSWQKYAFSIKCGQLSSLIIFIIFKLRKLLAR